MAPKGKAEAAAKPAVPKKTKAEKKEEEGPQMDPPDRKEFDAEMLKIQETIDALSKEQAEYAAKIGERSGGKEEYFEAKKNFKTQLDEFSAKIQALMDRKTEIQNTMGEKRKEGVDKRDQLNKMKKSIGYTSEKEIDERVAQIEFKMVSESFTLAEEKAMVKEIQQLKRNRQNIPQLHKMEEDLSTRDKGFNLKENIGQINEEMALYRDGKRQVSQKLQELNESRQELLGDYGKLIEARQEIGKKIKEQMDIRNQLREEFRQKEREFNQWKNEERRKKQDKIWEERAAKQSERDRMYRMKQAEKVDVQPHVTEMTLIEQTIFFCKGLIATKEVKEETKKVVTHDIPEGAELVVSKQDREDEYLFPPTAGKKKGKKKSQGGKESGPKPIKHNAETFKLFDQLKLDAPITTEDIPALVEKLEEQLASFKEKVAAWEKNRDELKAKILSGEATLEKEEEEAKEEAKEEVEETDEKKDDE
jgi:uncharacterized coiled-coil DUF342 family protein